MFSIRFGKLTLHPELQIVQADVIVELKGERIIDEPLCIDVGLPALMASALGDTVPDRFSNPVEEWRKMPFFVCGCGDPECRGYSFAVRHSGDEVIWTESEQSVSGVLQGQQYHVPVRQYREAVTAAAEQFLAFVDPLDYRPLNGNTVSTIRTLLETLRGGQ